MSEKHMAVSLSFGATEVKVDWRAFYPPAAGISVPRSVNKCTGTKTILTEILAVHPTGVRANVSQ